MQNKLLLIGLLFTLTSVSTASNSEVLLNLEDKKIMETIINQVNDDISVDDDFNAWELFDWFDKENQRRFVIQKALEYIHANNDLDTKTAINTAYDELEKKIIQKIDAMEKNDFINEEKIKDEASKYIDYLDADDRVRKNEIVGSSYGNGTTETKNVKSNNSEKENYTTIENNFSNIKNEETNTNDDNSANEFNVNYDTETKTSEDSDLEEATEYKRNLFGNFNERNYYGKKDENKRKADLSRNQAENDKTHFSSYDYDDGILQSEATERNENNKLNDENDYEYTGTSKLTDTTENKSGYYDADSNDDYSLYRQKNSEYSSKVDDTVISSDTNSSYSEYNSEIEQKTPDYSNNNLSYIRDDKDSYIDNNNDYKNNYSKNNSNIDNNRYINYNSKMGDKEYTPRKSKSNSEKLKEVKNDLNEIDIK